MRPHVLIVDDDPDILIVLERWFADDGLRVSTVRRAAAARAKMLREPVHLLLTDARLPGESGIELARSANEIGVPVLIMTGDAAWARDRGVEDGRLLAKPFDLDGLRQRVLQALLIR